MKTLRISFVALAVAVLAAACAGGNLPKQNATLPTPQSVSPALIPAAPMAKTAIQPSSAMTSSTAIKPMGSIQGMSWTQLPGSATTLAAAPDGSLWALSNQPAGTDKFIWHYANGTWTNISGLAKQLAVAPDGTLYAINSGGGTYAYSAGNWTALGGGASAITVAKDGSVYVLSNGGPGPDQAIWHNVGGTWSQANGSGTAIAASWDTGSYSGTAGIVNSGGIYIINSSGGIYYENPDKSFASFSGAASAIAATTSGGMFVLSYPGSASGNEIYYYDLSSSAWTEEPGAGLSLSSDGTHLYVVGGGNGIYEATITLAATPTPTPGNFPVSASVGGAAAYVAPNGYTLYVFDADGAGVSNCTLSTYSGCSATWPPLTAPAGSTASGDFSPIQRSDGTLQWAYQGHPLYNYSGDTGPYQMNGEGIVELDGHTWHVARPAGTVTPVPSSAPTDPPCRGYC